MSDFFAVAGVTSVLKWMLTDAIVTDNLNAAFPVNASVSALSPDLIPTGGSEPPQLNLFMYYASLNAAFRNNNLPSRDSNGTRTSNPPLALNLHYLVSAYGKDELDPEILLAWAMQIFYENPVLSRQNVEDLLTAMGSDISATPQMKAAAKTTLADQVELIKIVPEALSNEEIAKLWMAFNTHYRPTTSYQVSVVLIQETQRIKSNLPVQRRKVMAQPLQSPQIANITPSSAVVGDVLTITGSNFVGASPADTKIVFDSNAPISPDSLQGSTIRIKVPNMLMAGARSIRVIRNVTFGSPGDPHTGFSSSPAQFLLAPAIQPGAPGPVPVTVGTPLTLNVVPDVGRTQRVSLFIGDASIDLDARPPSQPDTSSSVTFNIPADFPHTNPATAVPLRLEVDGAQSKLTVDSNAANPTYGQFLPQAKVSGP